VALRVLVELGLHSGLGLDARGQGQYRVGVGHHVLLAEVAEQGRGEPGEAGEVLFRHAVERHGRPDLVALLGGEHEHETAAHAEADGADLRGGDGLVPEKEVDGSGEIAWLVSPHHSWITTRPGRCRTPGARDDRARSCRCWGR
jgi:hypothetical protein